MTDREIDNTIEILAGISPSGMSVHENLARYTAAAAFMELAQYEKAARLTKRGDPAWGYNIVSQIRTPLFAHVRQAVADDALQVMRDGDPAKMPGGADDRERAELFRRHPERFIAGATSAQIDVRQGTASIGIVTIAGDVVPWAYCTVAYARADVRDLRRYMEEHGHERGLVVGERQLCHVVPPARGIALVAVELGEAA